ncbi:MAG: alpha/beta hydrolase [Chitinophagaceae bacterium]|nr:MAG: alpha/beta hydrolase [Chitinophagaceae bacterium]
MTLYVLSGLGADARVFQKICWPEGVRVRHVPWVAWPPGESLPGYARRLAAGIDSTAPFALAGLSLGGMLAAEMSCFLEPRATLLLSSAASARRLPPWFRAPGLPALQALLPGWAYRQHHALLHWIFGLRTAEEKALFASIVRDADPHFVRAAIRGVLTWTRREAPPGLQSLHGAADRLLPARYAQPDYQVPGAGHLAVFTHAAAVSAWIRERLDLINDYKKS